jgi:hypothetical protein
VEIEAAPVAAPVEPPAEPSVAWRMALDPLGPHVKVLVEENAAFGGFEGGTLTLVVRSEMWRTRVRERLQELDFTRMLPGFRRLEVRLGDEGRTGREVRSEAEQRRLEAARAAVEGSPLVKRLLAAFGGKIESIEASALAEGDRSASSEESDE